MSPQRWKYKNVCVCVRFCEVVLYHSPTARIKAGHFWHPTFPISRVCMLLLSTFDLLDVTITADSGTTQSRKKKKKKEERQVDVPCVKLSLCSDRRGHNPSLAEWTVPRTIGSLWGIRSSVTTLYMHVSTHRCSYMHTTTTLFESGWKMSVLLSMSLPAT